MTTTNGFDAAWSGSPTFLKGKVALLRLPFYAKAPADSTAPALKRLGLAQGELAQFWSSHEGMRYIAGVEIVPGAIRGNHLHGTKIEVLYVLSGKVLLVAKDPHDEETVQMELDAGCLTRIQPGIAHALKGIQAGFAVECSPVEYDASDAVRHVVIQFPQN